MFRVMSLRLKDGVFTVPTPVSKHGLNFFDEDRLKKTQAILEKSFEVGER